MDRLENSLRELHIAPPMARRPLQVVMREIVRRNRVRNGIIYLQITRGVARRDHGFPKSPEPSLVMTARNLSMPPAEIQRQGVRVITIPDIRWKRSNIKSVSLLPNVLGKQQARDQGAYEALMVDEDGCVTEGTSSNAWIVTAGGELVTRHADQAILSGITRAAVAKIAAADGITITERPFHVDEAKTAKEVFLTSTTSLVKPVVEIDGHVVGNGHIGSLTEKLFTAYMEYMEGPGGGA